MMQGLKPSALVYTQGPSPSLCLVPPPLPHLWLLIASIYYLVILKLLSYVEIKAAEEQGETEVVCYGETCSAAVHGIPPPRHPAFHTSISDSCAGWAVHPLYAAAMGQGEVGGTAPGQVPPWWGREFGAAGTHSAAGAGEIPTCRLGQVAADKW